MHPSVKNMWDAYLALFSPASLEVPPAWHFCDNEVDADACAQLVLAGTKRATSPSLWFFESKGEPLSQPGDLDIVTDWKGLALCIIRTTRVQILPFDQVTESHASLEGEGDKTLEVWRQLHWPYYHRELEGTGYSPQPDMPIVFQAFERIFPPQMA